MYFLFKIIIVISVVDVVVLPQIAQYELNK